MQRLKVLQCNLGREKLAHEMAFATMAERNFDLMVVGEPNLKTAEGNGWVIDRSRVVAVYFRNKKIRVHKVERHTGYVEIRLPGVTIVAGYISPNIELITYEEALERMLGGRRQGEDLIIMGDFNAKAPMWGSPNLDRRGEILGEWVDTLGLTVLNDGKEPTFVRGNSSSYIDVTFASGRVARSIDGWEVLDMDSGTLHKYIAFQIAGNRIKETGRTFRTTDWAQFREDIRRKSEGWQGDGLPEEKMSKELGETYKKCLGPPRRGNGGGMPYWWNEEIKEARDMLVRARREVTRARRRAGALHNEGELTRLWRTYKDKKKTLNNMILRAKTDHWERLCKDLEENPWGDAYRIVSKRIGVKPYEMTLQRKKEVARELFPVIQDLQEERDDWAQAEAPPFTLDELRTALTSLKTGKAPGIDGIPPEAIKEMGKVAEESLLAVLNSLLARQHIPETWKTARLVLIPKDEEAEKSRPICLLNSDDKLFETLVKVRLEQEIQERGGLSDMQHGFRKGHSTVHAILEAVKMRRNIQWATIITLDVKNAFNTVRWTHITRELERRGISQYLRNIVRVYLRDRKIEVERGELMEVYAGVPQGSVLGPTLWNIAYDQVLRLRWPAGIKVVGFADDLAMVAVATSEGSLIQSVNEALRMVDEWLSDNELELAPHKTEAVMVRGPRKKNQTTFSIRNVDIRPQKAIKYLGVWVDDQGTYGHHIKEVTKKAATRTAAMSRVMPNIGGPSFIKRRIIYQVVSSTLLYAAPAWLPVLQIGRYKNMLLAAQRRALLRVAMAYRTVSTPAIQVITGEPPITLLAEERERLFKRQDRNTQQAKKEEREATMERWQREWEEDVDGKGQWTRTIIPQIRRWVKCEHRHLNYFMTQALTGHGSFRTFTHKIKKTEDDNCVYCGETDTPAHTLFECPRWETERREVERNIGEVRTNNFVNLLTASKDKWKVLDGYITKIMSTKESEERARQAEA